MTSNIFSKKQNNFNNRHAPYFIQINCNIKEVDMTKTAEQLMEYSTDSICHHNLAGSL